MMIDFEILHVLTYQNLASRPACESTWSVRYHISDHGLRGGLNSFDNSSGPIMYIVNHETIVAILPEFGDYMFREFM